MSMPVFVADMYPINDNAYFTWRNICRLVAVEEAPIPLDLDGVIEEAVGQFVDTQIGEFIPTKEWVFGAGRKQAAWGIKFKTSKGMSSPFVASSKSAVESFMTALGPNPVSWVGKKLRLQVTTVQKYGAKNGVKTMCVRAKLIPEEAK